MSLSECETIVHPYVSHVAKCVNDYTATTELKEPFNIHQARNQSPPHPEGVANAFIYQTSEQTNALSYWGKFATYSGGGFVANFNYDMQDIWPLASGLLKNNWLDKHTRALFCEITVYNVNMNLFTTIKIIIEAPSSGGFAIYDDIQTGRVYNYIGGWGVVIFAVQIIWLVTVVYTIVKEGIKIRKQRKIYFQEFWNIVELANIIVAIICIATFVIKVSKTVQAVETMHGSKGMHS